MLRLQRVIRKVNIIHPICTHLLGERHTHVHRMCAGFVVMGAGVFIAKSAHHFHAEVAHYFLDGLGYFVHGVGAAPYVEAALETAATEEKETQA